MHVGKGQKIELSLEIPRWSDAGHNNVQIGQISLPLVVFLLLLSSSGCKPSGPGGECAGGESFGRWRPLIRWRMSRSKSAGDFVQASWILEDGQSLDGLQVTPELREKMTRADVLITGGAAEPWAVEGYDDPSRADHIVRLDLTPMRNSSPMHGSCGSIRYRSRILRSDRQKLTVQLPSQADLFAKNAKNFSDRIDEFMHEFDSADPGDHGDQSPGVVARFFGVGFSIEIGGSYAGERLAAAD